MTVSSRPTRPAPLRILMIAPTSFFADYGCHVRILEETTALQRIGHIVRICTYHNGRDLPGIDIRRSVDVPWLKRAEVGSSRHKAYLDVALLVEAARQARRFKPDVIHAHLHEGALIGSIIGRIAHVPVIFDYQGSLTEEMLDHGFLRRGGLSERFFRKLERTIDRLPDRIVPSGVAGLEYLQSHGVPKSRIRHVPDAVDLERFDPEASRAAGAAVRSQLGIPADARVVVYLGLLAEYQGTTVLLEAAQRYLRDQPDTYFIVAGYPGVEWYAQKADVLGISARMTFPGKIDYEDAPALLAAGDIAVAPKLSTTESNGKIFNYMAMELPTVATDSPTNRAILGELGYFFGPGDAADMAAKLADAFSADESRRAALRARIANHFDWDDRISDLLDVYREVTGRAIAAPIAEATSASAD
ncbi:MAG: glycosyltransferase family 4 protein [Thermomicrobiales bacterium]|nr:glycosyltransferase family 4 protein [Thermomicrobiales bacterium]